MSSNVPPPYDPGQPYGGQPDDGQPYAGQAGQPGQPGQPEFLGTEPTPPRKARRTALIAGGVVGGLAVIGGGAWAASWYLSSGASAAQMLPAATVAYVEVNLDPSGSQKIAALDTLNKFPAFADEVGIGSKDDLRQKLFELVQTDGTCQDLDYADDVKPWLGDRAAFAVVDEGGDKPVPVAVLEVTDVGEAKAGLAKLRACGDDGTADAARFVISDGWAYVAGTTAEAQKVVDLTGDRSLADDSDYQHLTGAAGGTGVATAYVAPDAGAALQQLTDAVDQPTGGEGGSAAGALDSLKDFGGLAVQVRFESGGLEVESASSVEGDAAAAILSTDGVAAVGDLPQGTAAAFGVAPKSGWGDSVLDQISTRLGSLGLSRDEHVQQVERATGLTVPDDVETLLGSSSALAVSGDLDVDAIVNSSDPSSVPVGMRIVGDADQVGGVLDKVRTTTGQSQLLQSTSDGDVTAVGPDSDWNTELVGDGALGDSATFSDVVPDASRAASVLYVDADTHDEWLVRALTALGVGSDVTDNIKPLKALGVAGWVDGDLGHSKIVLTTD